MRLSNYYIWQAAYAEFYSSPRLWPDFGHDDFVAALDAFAARKRRFGKTDAQIEAEAAEAKRAAVSSDSATQATTPAPQAAEKIRSR